MFTYKELFQKAPFNEKTEMILQNSNFKIQNSSSDTGKL